MTSGAAGSGAAPGDDQTGAFADATPVDPATFKGAVTDVGFTSPSANISCGIQDGSLVCQIQHFTYTPRPAGNCHGGGYWGNDIELNSNAPARFGCNGGVASGGPDLAYGQRITVGAVRCVSRQDAVTCQNTISGYGFRLASAAYRFFHATGTSDATSRIPTALAGQWQGHGRLVTITAGGSGTLVYRTYTFCSTGGVKPCDRIVGNKLIDGGQIQFGLTTSSNATSAQGNITRSSDPQYPSGLPLTARVTGYYLYLSFWPKVPFCAANAPSGEANCGA